MFRKFRGLPEYSPAEVLEKVRTGLATGRVKIELDHPLAAACFPSASTTLTSGKFAYLEVEVLAPHRPHFWRAKVVRDRRHDGGLYVRWGIKGFGFGEASIVCRDGAWTSDTEMLGPDFMKDALAA